MYLNKVKVDERPNYNSDVLPDETINKILSLIFNNEKMKKMNKDKNIVRIIRILKHIIIAGSKLHTENFKR